jgi:carboxyl-terminal processing protease
MFDNKELVIGKLEPGKSRTVTIPGGWCETKGRKIGSSAPLPKDLARTCSVPKDALMRADGVTVHFDEARGHAPADAEMHVAIDSLEKPIFAYSYQIADNRKGNGDGKVQKGEDFTMWVTIKNVGKGRSFETQANLRNLSGDGLLLHDGRFDVSNMQPGETRHAAFTFDVMPSLTEDEVKFELSIADQDLRESAVEKMKLPIAPAITITSSSGASKAGANGAALLESPEMAARHFGKLLPGTAVNVLGTAGPFSKVSLGDNRFGFVKTAEMDQGGSPSTAVAFEDALAHAPPALELQAPALATKDTHTILKGVLSDDERLLDAYIFVGGRKVFYRSNRTGTDPKKLTFEADLPLRAGVNVVSVVARENPDTTSRRVYVVRRDGPNGELLATPKTDDDLSEAGSQGDD